MQIMKIVSMHVNEECVQKLFAEHDDYMMNFLTEDKCYYTRYSEQENIEKVWLVSIDNHSAGCIAYRKKADGVAEVKRLFIRKEYCGQGIAKCLLKTVERFAIEQGYHTLFLDTRITLEPAVSIYQAFGFQIVFQQGLYIQMEKRL